MLDFGYRTQTSATADVPRARKHHHPNLERLICAAVSNARLAALLVQAPAQALAQFPVGRCLTAAERRLVLQIEDAPDIYEFAGRLHALVLQMHAPDTGDTVSSFGRAPAYAKHTPARSNAIAAPAAVVMPAPQLAHVFAGSRMPMSELPIFNHLK